MKLAMMAAASSWHAVAQPATWLVDVALTMMSSFFISARSSGITEAPVEKSAIKSQAHLAERNESKVSATRAEPRPNDPQPSRKVE